MSDLIRREDAIRVVEGYFEKILELNPDICLDGLRSLPTVDAVSVVRCRDCVHCDCLPDYMGFFYCDFDEGRTVSGNGFCDVGERRQDAQLD